MQINEDDKKEDYATWRRFISFQNAGHSNSAGQRDVPRVAQHETLDTTAAFMLSRPLCCTSLGSHSSTLHHAAWMHTSQTMLGAYTVRGVIYYSMSGAVREVLLSL